MRPVLVTMQIIESLITSRAVTAESAGMASPSPTFPVASEQALADAHRELERLRAQLAAEQEARVQWQLRLDSIDAPLQHVGDSVQFLGDAFEDLARLFHGYRDALISLRSTHTPAAARLADLLELEAACDLEFLAGEVPKALARSLEEAEQLAGIVRALKAAASRSHSE
jgi:hypothetical protein